MKHERIRFLSINRGRQLTVNPIINYIVLTINTNILESIVSHHCITSIALFLNLIAVNMRNPWLKPSLWQRWTESKPLLILCLFDKNPVQSNAILFQRTASTSSLYKRYECSFYRLRISNSCSTCRVLHSSNYYIERPGWSRSELSKRRKKMYKTNGEKIHINWKHVEYVNDKLIFFFTLKHVKKQKKHKVIMRT